MMTVRTKFAKRIDVSYQNDADAELLESSLKMQLRTEPDYDNGYIVVGRNTDTKTVYVIFYEDCQNIPFKKLLV